MIKIAAIIPVGPLGRMGYQYNYELCLKNLASEFDNIFLISNTTQKIEIFDLKNVTVIMDENSVFLRENDNDIFDMEKIYNNVYRAALIARDQQYDFAFLLSINNYVEKNFKLKFLKQIIVKKNQEKAWHWLYKAYQIGNAISEPSIRVPYIINLSYIDQIKFLPDSIMYKNKIFKIENGLWIQKDINYIVDIMGDYNKSDLEEKWYYYEQHLCKYLNISAIKPSWKVRIDYLNTKIRTKFYRKDVDHLGREILKNLPDDAIVFSLESLKKLNQMILIKIFFKNIKKILFDIFKFKIFLV